MAAISEILVGGGVAAMLAATIGGGLRAFGTEMPLIASPRRQALLFAVGAVLVAIGIGIGSVAGAGTAERAPQPPPAAAGSAPLRPAVHPGPQVSGMTVIDFRSSRREDPLTPGRGQGYLLVTTNLAVANDARPAQMLTWTGTSAVLRIGPASVPFRDYYFTNLTDNPDDPWLGRGEVSASPVLLNAGTSVSHDVMFMPENAGTGRYQWDDFLRAINQPGADHPVFEIIVRSAIDGVEARPVNLRCVARVDEQMPEVRRLAQAGAAGYRITAACTQ